MVVTRLRLYGNILQLGGHAFFYRSSGVHPHRAFHNCRTADGDF